MQQKMNIPSVLQTPNGSDHWLATFQKLWLARNIPKYSNYSPPPKKIKTIPREILIVSLNKLKLSTEGIHTHCWTCTIKIVRCTSVYFVQQAKTQVLG
jgi:hypothetical protein